MNIEPYLLPDSLLLTDSTPMPGLLVWQPERTILVLGFSNNPERSLQLKEVMEDGIPVTRRPTGGDAILLTPLMLAVSLLYPNPFFLSPYSFFPRFNGALASALNAQGVEGVLPQGISDLTLNRKKIVGAALYQGHGRLFYHAVLNVAESGDTFTRYLNRPERQPQYRENRPHDRFITSLHREGYNLDIPSLRRQVEEHFHRTVLSEP